MYALNGSDALKIEIDFNVISARPSVTAKARAIEASSASNVRSIITPVSAPLKDQKAHTPCARTSKEVTQRIIPNILLC